MNWIEIDNTANVADSNGYGAVSYSYKISQTLVTVEDYTAFLNAVAKYQQNGLWLNDWSGSKVKKSTKRSQFSLTRP